MDAIPAISALDSNGGNQLDASDAIVFCIAYAIAYLYYKYRKPQ